MLNMEGRPAIPGLAESSLRQALQEDDRQMANSGTGNGTYIPQPDIFDSITPEEIVIIASVFAIFLASELSDDNATSLAFFFSTMGSNMGLFIDRRGRERIPALPGVG